MNKTYGITISDFLVKGIFCALFLCISIFSICILFCGAVGIRADTKERPFYIGYAQVREYSSFAQQLLLIAEELEAEGSIAKGFSEKYKDTDYDQSFQDGDTLALWRDICANNTQGARYRFVEHAFFDMNQMKESEYETMVNREDVDLMFTMGTGAGTYFLEHEQTNKYMVLLAADPIASGIVKSEYERYTDNSYALLDNTAYIRQIKVGHQFLHFKKLGIVYEDSENAYAYSAVGSVKKMAKELGFELLERHVDEPENKSEEPVYYENLKQAYRELVKEGMDTLYITVGSIDYEKKMQELLEDTVIPQGIATLAQDDVAPVQYGALFGVSLVDYREQAGHIVAQIREYVENGAAFNTLDQICECTPRIFVNYTTAQAIGFQIKFADLQIIDMVYK